MAVSSSITITQEALTQAFSQALGNSLPQILAALQGQSTPSNPSPVITSAPKQNLPSISTTTESVASQSPLSSLPGQAIGNILILLFISTYYTLVNRSLTTSSFTGAPSWFGSRCAMSASSSFSAVTSLALYFPSSSSLTFSSMSSLNKAFVVGPGYSFRKNAGQMYEIPLGQFFDLANLLPENLKSQESEPQTFLDGKLVITPSKKASSEYYRHCDLGHGFFQLPLGPL